MTNFETDYVRIKHNAKTYSSHNRLIYWLTSVMYNGTC